MSEDVSIKVVRRDSLERQIEFCWKKHNSWGYSIPVDYCWRWNVYECALIIRRNPSANVDLLIKYRWDLRRIRWSTKPNALFCLMFFPTQILLDIALSNRISFFRHISEDPPRHSNFCEPTKSCLFSASSRNQDSFTREWRHLPTLDVIS